MPPKSYADRAELISTKPKKAVVLAEWAPTVTRAGKRRFVPVEVESTAKNTSSSTAKRTRTSSPTKQASQPAFTTGSAPAPNMTWSEGDLDMYGTPDSTQTAKNVS